MWQYTNTLYKICDVFECDNCRLTFSRETMRGVGRYRKTYCSVECRNEAKIARQKHKRYIQRMIRLETHFV